MKEHVASLIGIVSIALTSAAAQTAFLFPTNPVPQVKLGWTNNAPSVTNFYLYYGVGSRQYTNKVPMPAIAGVGTVVSNAFPLPVRGVQFFFAVTCQDIKGLESTNFSNEVTYTAPNPPDAPTMQPVVVLVVQSAPTPAGLFADAGMNWSLSPDQSQQYYRLNMNRGVVLQVATPPMPSK